MNPTFSRTEAQADRSRPTLISFWLLVCLVVVVHVSAAAESPPNTAESPPNTPTTPSPAIDLNTATETDLDRLPGIGPTKAKGILAYRAKVGRFKDASELIRVKGIGRATFRKLKPLVRVEKHQGARAKEPLSRH